MTLTFTATNQAGKSAETSSDGSVLTLEADEGADVTFTLTSPDKIDQPVIKRQEDDQAVDVDYDVSDPKRVTAVYKATTFGTFLASATLAGTPTTADQGVRLVKAAAATTQPVGRDPQEDQPSEIEVGEFDRWFAISTLLFATLISAGVGFVVWTVISRVFLPAAGALVAEDQVPDGTFGQRAALILLSITAGIGGVTLITGAWLAALETRGRLRAAIKNTDPGKGGIAAAELKEVGNVIDKVRKLRGSIAVVLSGLLILALTIWGVRPLTGATPTPTSTPTAPSSPTPITTPTPTPSGTAQSTQPTSDVSSSDPAPTTSTTG